MGRTRVRSSIVSLDIETYVGNRPKNLRHLWQDEFASAGLTCEFRPDFDPATWTAGDLVAKVEVMPKAFPGAERYGNHAFTASCYLEIQAWPEFSKEYL